jgi:hypothetical protein
LVELCGNLSPTAMSGRNVVQIMCKRDKKMCVEDSINLIAVLIASCLPISDYKPKIIPTTF